jgi:mRNA interferase HicA
MNRDALIRRIGQLARDQGKEFQFDKSRGKGSHGTLYYDGKRSVCPKGELKKGTLLKILKDLGINRDFLR